MLNRYPHTILMKPKLVISKNDNGLKGSELTGEPDVYLNCRVEMTDSKSTEYSAKLYANLQEVELFRNDGLHLIYDGRQFKVLKFQQKQTYLVAWLV